MMKTLETQVSQFKTGQKECEYVASGSQKYSKNNALVQKIKTITNWLP